MTVSELLERMTSSEIAEWMAYDRIDPFGGQRTDAAAAMVSATVAQCHSGKRQNLSDFMLKFGKPARKSVDQMKQIFGAFKKACERGNHRKTQRQA